MFLNAFTVFRKIQKTCGLCVGIAAFAGSVQYGGFVCFKGVSCKKAVRGFKQGFYAAVQMCRLTGQNRKYTSF